MLVAFVPGGSDLREGVLLSSTQMNLYIILGMYTTLKVRAYYIGK